MFYEHYNTIKDTHIKTHDYLQLSLDGNIYRVFDYKGKPKLSFLIQKATDEYILMQSTGITDIHGKEIYEGDIVEVLEFDKKEDRIQTIIFNDCKYQTVSIWGEDIKDKAKIDICGNSPFGERWRMKVIGNIFENKDLLKN